LILVQEACPHTASQLYVDDYLASEVPQVVVDLANCTEQAQETY